MALVNILAWIIVGGIAGWLASLLVRAGGMGIVGDIIVGIVGALIGGFVLSLLLARHVWLHRLQPGQSDRRLHRRGDPALHRQALHRRRAVS